MSDGACRLRECWINAAAELDRAGHFTRYSTKQRDEVLRKGYLGPWSPDRSIAIAREQAEKGFAQRTPKFNDEARDNFGLVGEDLRKTILKILDELSPEYYAPPSTLEEPPGCPFRFRSRLLGSDVYFKFQVIGTMQRPQVLFWSLHPPLH